MSDFVDAVCVGLGEILKTRLGIDDAAIRDIARTAAGKHKSPADAVYAVLGADPRSFFEAKRAASMFRPPRVPRFELAHPSDAKLYEILDNAMRATRARLEDEPPAEWRERADEYADITRELEAMVGEIIGEWSALWKHLRTEAGIHSAGDLAIDGIARVIARGWVSRCLYVRRYKAEKERMASNA